jgi:hypothetical protein
MLDDKPIIDTTHELKWRRTLRRKLINCLALIENHGKPTQELMFELRMAKEALRNWNSDSADWVKHRMSFPLNMGNILSQAESDIQESEVQPINTD